MINDKKMSLSLLSTKQNPINFRTARRTIPSCCSWEHSQLHLSHSWEFWRRIHFTARHTSRRFKTCYIEKLCFVLFSTRKRSSKVKTSCRRGLVPGTQANWLGTKQNSPTRKLPSTNSFICKILFCILKHQPNTFQST